ncbi:MAG: ABC transporter ATP-binding protein [Oscillatoriales cyanobacterium]|uniref:ABC transporter ATP-binding protein n=1 Tax=Microcoleus anatoxicus PTRS2 TaxID=2705321 RepID=A0ABU8YUD0_9CYAN|nr:MAG: ABC transporter ATP-binding protein [Oscillatoriales cyanobacterium]TAD94887.1 MAG: ABC transporter ATP-binding protein [Oscillatoriales cyanobacterium]TAE05244.1 MAG: ABC transporter ATP-binding protein [Oscillatoriales cyanobacterium]TAF02992.1 MAG: ABC transporter ATP-binding protein [Oscillatoriales cyanobacterium]TAF48262.1 MAG: ABC transporter ATP-binding protein [Oscillatoriales cyanobacterium]
MAEPLIELKGISKSFNQTPILDGVDLKIYRGEALAIIGPSGTGKSTILRIIAGLLVPDAGEVFVQGQRRIGWVDDVTDPIGIGMVFQQAALFDSLTVEENVGFLLYQHSKLSRRRIRELVEEKLEMVGLPKIGDRYPAQLSGGMRKRVSFARAIMANPDHARDNPEVLLYDEPTAGLDPIASTVIEDLIRDLQRAQGVCSTYAIVTHQDSTIRRTADRIVFLYRGKVQWEGQVSDIATTDNLLIQQFFSGRVTGPIQVIG